MLRLFRPRLRIGPPRAGDFLPATAPPPPRLRLAAVGDEGTSRPEVHQTARAMVEASSSCPYDSLVLLGDNVYPHGDPAHLQTAVFDPFGPLLDAGARLLPVLGNHDVEGGHGDAQAQRLGMPGRWYSTRLGDDVLFLGLDSNQADNPAQLDWLAEALGRDRSGWKIAALHHPPYSAGHHRSDLGVRDSFCPLFERFGVQLVLAGHEHDYQRSKPVTGTTYVVSGGAARVRPTAKAPFTEVAFSTRHFTDLHVYDDRLLLRAVDQQGRVFDQATVWPEPLPRAGRLATG